LLDHTLVLYGSSNSNTHNNSNYPTVLAGGTRIGISQGQFLKFTEDTPFSNVHLTILRRLQADTTAFADSTGEIADLLA
jgi:hypothetical protein